MVRRIVSFLAGVAGAVVLVSLALANRHPVMMSLDPFGGKDPIVSLNLPLFWYLFFAVIVGIVLGGMATWLSQGKWRYTARKRTQEAMRWKAEAERLGRERDENVAASRTLIAANR